MSKDKIVHLSVHCKDLSGCHFGRLTVLEPVGRNKHSIVLWKCHCDCGQECVIDSHGLINGDTKSCGCLRREKASVRLMKHGMCKSPEYRSWQNMLTRCENPDNKDFQRYGGRGIKVCTRWHKFENFFKDMGKRPESKTLDRTKNNGNYEPKNCRWATMKEQSTNRRPRSFGLSKQRWFRAWKSDQMCQYLSSSQRQFAKDHGLNRKCIASCLCNIQKSHRGWTFRRIPTPQV